MVVQKCNTAEEPDDKDGKKKVNIGEDQYFFIDSRNNIEIMFPNFESKVQRTKAEDLIIRKANIKIPNSSYFKKITYVDQYS